MKKLLNLKTVVLIVLVLASMFSFTACFNQTKVEFVVDGVIPYTIYTDGNERLNLPVPKKEGYDFLGWYYDDVTFEIPFKEDSLVNVKLDKNLKVYAKFVKENMAEITLEKNIDEAGEVTGGGIFKIGSEITVTATTNKGFEFEGFFEGDKLVCSESSYSFIVEKSSTLVAKWSHSKCTVIYRSVRKFKINGSTQGIIQQGDFYIFTEHVEYGAVFYPKDKITSGTFSFDGWEDKDGNIFIGGGKLEQVEDLILTAKWESDPDWTDVY